MEDTLTDKLTGPDHPLRDVQSMPDYAHKFKGDTCVKCDKTIQETRFTICDGDANK